MIPTRLKTLSYRRAEWVATGLTLEGCLRDAHAALKTVTDRTIVFGAHHVRSVKTRDAKSGGLLLHITAEIPGQAASVVPKVAPTSAELDLQTAQPPTGGEWLEGDAFFFVRGDHVCMCATEVHDAVTKQYFYTLFEKANLSKNSTKFDLLKVADINKVKLLHQQGVKELQIRATLYKATANYLKRKEHVVGVTGVIGKHLKAFLGKPHDITPDGLRVILTLKTDGRQPKSALAIGEKEIEKLAADVVKNCDVEEKEDYLIITQTGERLTPDSIFLKQQVEIQSDGKTVNCDKAWAALTSFYDGLIHSGALEQ